MTEVYKNCESEDTSTSSPTPPSLDKEKIYLEVIPPPPSPVMEWRLLIELPKVQQELHLHVSQFWMQKRFVMEQEFWLTDPIAS